MTNLMAAPVLILTNQRDFAADRVIRCLQDLDVPVERWNAEDQRVVSWRPEQVKFDRPPRTVWLRQFLPEPTVMGNVREVDDFLVAREQWRTWLSDLAEDPAPRWMNPLWTSRRAENKLIQLRVARECGLEAPATLMTNNRALALRHQDAVGPCVVKSVASAYFPFSDSSFMFTVDLDDAAHLPEDEWSAQPLLVQKTVIKGADVRVFMVGDFAAAVSTHVYATDWRTTGSDAKWELQDIPPRIVDSCLHYLKSLGLVYGAFDFVVDPTSQWWFLECNQAGEFSFADRPLNLGVSDAIAAWLAAEPR